MLYKAPPVVEERLDLKKLIRRMDEYDHDAANIWQRFVPSHKLFRPDVVIAPEGSPYLYRWYLFPNATDTMPTVMFHLQVASDPERPLHDHPWDNTSVILYGGYDEIVQEFPPEGVTVSYMRKRGDVIQRKAIEAHRLILPPRHSFAMTLFSTGPKIRDWGFWYPDGWHHNQRHVADRDGQSVHVKEIS